MANQQSGCVAPDVIVKKGWTEETWCFLERFVEMGWVLEGEGTGFWFSRTWDEREEPESGAWVGADRILPVSDSEADVAHCLSRWWRTLEAVMGGAATVMNVLLLCWGLVGQNRGKLSSWTVAGFRISTNSGLSGAEQSAGRPCCFVLLSTAPFFSAHCLEVSHWYQV